MSELSAVVSDYGIDEVKSWSPKQVCSWMVALGFERELVEKFERNDISGAILVDLKWEDLKEVSTRSAPVRARNNGLLTFRAVGHPLFRQAHRALV